MKKGVTKQNLDSLLISPPPFYRKSKSIWTEVESNFPQLGLADIAAYVRSKGYSVQIIDCSIVAPSVQAFDKWFKKNYVSLYDSIRFIGFTATTVEIKKAYMIAKICKNYYPNVLIIFGGVHATFLPKEVIKNNYVDVVVVGEGEITFEELLRNIPLSKIDGIVYKKYSKEGYEIIYNKPRERIKNLDIMPMPAYDLLPIKKYYPAKGSYKQLPAMSMITSRGCPGICTFCAKTLGKKLVYKSAETIIKEIQFLINEYGIKQFQFYDDTFTTFRENVIELCKIIISNKIDISWSCFARVDYISYKLLKYMKRANCHQIMYGIETIDKNVLNNIKKKINISQVINAIKWTKQVGIESRLAFMVGNPGDTKESIMRNIDFVNQLNPEYLIVNITTPYPGTEMFNWADKKNLILTYNWDDYDLSRPVMRLENLEPSEIEKLCSLMYKRFYMRPKYLFNRILKIRSIGDFKVLLEGIKSLFVFFKG